MKTPRFIRLSDAYQRPPGASRGVDFPSRFDPSELLARIWSVFGPPHEGKPDEQFLYKFLDTKTRVGFQVASFKGRAPEYKLLGTYDGAVPPPPEPDAHFWPDKGSHEGSFGDAIYRATAEALLREPAGPVDGRALLSRAADLAAANKKFREPVLAFEKFLAPVKLADCELIVQTDDGELFRIGAKEGHLLEAPLSFADAIDFYIDLVKRHGPKCDGPIRYLAEPQEMIRELWLEASDDDRKERPDAVEYARRAWQDELEQLPKMIVLSDGGQRDWAESWSRLDSNCALLGMSTPAIRQELDRLREPPPVPKLTDAEREALTSALEDRRRIVYRSEDGARELAEKEREFALNHPDLAPARLVSRLATSPSAEERHLAGLLRDALRP